MDENISWIFSGIGTEAIGSIISFVVGAVAVYDFGYNKQKQKSGDKSKQAQNNKTGSDISINIQTQIADDESLQIQVNNYDRYK